MVVTPKIDSAAPTLKIPLTLFKADAHSDLVRLLHPAEWLP